MLAVLKVLAWRDRNHLTQGKDAMDLRLISTLLGTPPVPVNRLAEGDCRCAYRVGTPGAEGSSTAATPAAITRPQRTAIPLHLDAVPA